MMDGDHGLTMRKLEEKALKRIPKEIGRIAKAGDAATEAARKAIFDSFVSSCNSTLSEALAVQAKHSADFMISTYCKKGMVGMEYTKTMLV